MKTPPAVPEPRFTLEDFLSVRGIYDLSPSPDGSEVAFVSNLDGTPQLWKMPGAGGFPAQLTFDPKLRFNPLFGQFGTGLVRYSPDGDWIACLLDHDGDEQNRILLVRSDGAARRSLPWIAGEQCHLGAWSRDGRSFYFTSNRRDARYFDVYRFDLSGSDTRLVFAADDWHSVPGVPPLGGKLPLTRATTHRRTDLLLLDLPTGRAQNLTPWHGDYEAVPAGWESATSLVVNLRAPGHAFLQAARMTAQGDLWRPSLLSRSRWDKTVCVAPGGRFACIVENADGRDAARWLRLRGRARPRARLPAGGTLSFLRFSADARFAFFAHGTHVKSDDLYRVQVSSGKPVRLTDLGNRRVPDDALTDARLVHYRSDGKRVSSWLFLPRNGRDSGEKPPVAVWIHGGPKSQVRARYQPRLQFLASLGLSVWAPNHRGSTGYGDAFATAIDRNWGTVDLRDLVAGLSWLTRSGLVDTRRMAAMGGSYGGYMTLRALTELPRRWRCGVDIFGPSNLSTMIESSPPSWRKYVAAEIGDPAVDRGRLTRQSPLFRMGRVRAPLLVIQGRNDPRVVQRESDQVVSALKRRGIPVEYVVFPDEGHGFSRRENEHAAYAAIGRFLSRHLRPEAGRGPRRVPARGAAR